MCRQTHYSTVLHGNTANPLRATLFGNEMRHNMIFFERVDRMCNPFISQVLEVLMRLPIIGGQPFELLESDA